MALEDREEAVGLLEGKQSKKSVDYRPSSEDMDEDWCGACVNFENQGKNSGPCTVVAGEVFDRDVCDLFQEAPEEDELAVPREQEGAIIEELL